MLPTIEVLIGLFFVFAVSSLAASALSELLETWLFKLRAKYLADGLTSLLGSEAVRDEVMSHPLLKGLGRADDPPTYIPTRTFALALLETVTRNPLVVLARTDEELKASRARRDESRKRAVGFEQAAKAAEDAAKAAPNDQAQKDVAARARQEATDAEEAAKKDEQRVADEEAAIKRGQEAAATAARAAEAARLADQAAKDATLARIQAEQALAAADAAGKSTAEQRLAQKTAEEKAAIEKAKVLTPKLPLPLGTEGVEAFLRNLPDSQLKTALSAVLMQVREGEREVGTLIASVGKWFDDGMDQVTGWYKRANHQIIFGLGFLIAATMNLDAIAVTRALATDESLRQVVVRQAEAYMKAASETSAADGGVVTAGTPDGSTPDAGVVAPSATDRLESAKTELKKLGLPIGWETAREVPPWPGYPLRFLGWLITALATSLGAPFWFDLLKRVMLVRAGLNPDEDSRQKSSKQKMDA